MMMEKIRLKYILVSVGFLLLIPFIAMQFTDAVNWGIMDFAVAGLLLLVTGLLLDFALRKIESVQYRIVIVIVLLILLLLFWAELAVGVVDKLLGGS